MPILKPQRLAVVIFIVVRVTPSIAVHQITPMPNIFIVVELKFILLHNTSIHSSKKHPWAHVESGQLHKYFAFGLSYFCQARPIHIFVISCLQYPIWHPENMLVGVGSKNILGFNFPCLHDSFLGLLIVLLSHDFKFLWWFSQSCFLIFEFVYWSGIFIG